VLKVCNISKTFKTDCGDVGAVNDVSFEVKKGEFYTLLGPSGCGKSTILRCIAGLERQEVGDIYIDGTLVASTLQKVFVPPEKRPIAMVFQSYAIWPHMNVFNNVAYPLVVGGEKLKRREIKERVDKILAVVGLEELGQRPAPELSGGQQQRVALARGLVKEPKLMLLDEPLSNLDAKLREEMRFGLQELIKRTGVTTLYVTHDQIEALAMSDKVALMRNGKIIQESSPFDIYVSPKDKFTAEFIGRTNFIDGEVVDEPAGFTIPKPVKTPQGVLYCFIPDEVKRGDQVTISIRPENIFIFEKDIIANGLNKLT
jgi:iron(III) transport system ATP-binding protein